MKKGFWILCLVFLSLQTAVWGFSFKDVVNPKSICADCYVSNADGILTKQTEERLNRQLEELYRKTTAQVAIVAVAGEATTSARDLSMQLFDSWKVGEKGADNGLIILLCVNSRDVFLRTGYGLEGALSDAAVTRIFSEQMVPYFRQGDWDKGMMAAADEVCRILYKEYAENGFAKPEPIDYTPYIYAYFALCVAFLAAAVVAVSSKVSKISAIYKADRISALKHHSLVWVVLGIVFLPADLLLLFWIYGIKQRGIRKQKIKCECGTLMSCLPETQEDDYLNTARQLEERLGSRDYDVWLCRKCHSTKVFGYDKAFSQYDKCPHCGAKTYIKKYDTVVRPASTLREGVMKSVYECANCHRGGEKLTSIPKKPPVVIVGGVPGGGSGGGFSSGGSWGGGFSGGGGGGGRF